MSSRRLICALDLDHTILHMLRASEMPENSGFAEDVVEFVHDEVVYKVALRIGTTSFVRALRKADVTVIIVTCNLVADKVMEALSKRCDVFQALECHIIESRERGAKSLEMIGVNSTDSRITIFDDSPSAWRFQDQEFIIHAKRFDAKTLAAALDADDTDDDLLDEELGYMSQMQDDFLKFYKPPLVVDFLAPVPVLTRSASPAIPSVKNNNTSALTAESKSTDSKNAADATPSSFHRIPIVMASSSAPTESISTVSSTAPAIQKPPPQTQDEEKQTNKRQKTRHVLTSSFDKQISSPPTQASFSNKEVLAGGDNRSNNVGDSRENTPPPPPPPHLFPPTQKNNSLVARPVQLVKPATDPSWRPQSISSAASAASIVQPSVTRGAYFSSTARAPAPALAPFAPVHAFNTAQFNSNNNNKFAMGRTFPPPKQLNISNNQYSPFTQQQQQHNFFPPQPMPPPQRPHFFRGLPVRPPQPHSLPPPSAVVGPATTQNNMMMANFRNY
uniref:FCP1 homology domain-containing protein n=1 Tax=Aureoumbra lagunensis TaxID=44058 RepID=A0A7S3K064_9STRA|mmetsp:Transcript_8911/g.12390  ORF Transcript_8911/g.12390 Transcript_8911/m.12390 type:complete len:503 (+) Transcript_8911:246-1754(+)